MTKKEIQLLFKKYVDGTCSEEEKIFLEDWFVQWNKDLSLGIDEEELVEELDRMTNNLFPQKVKTIGLWRKLAVAASVIFLIGVSLLFFNKNYKQVQGDNQKVVWAPITNRAYLTLSNGKQILLTSSNNGIIANQIGVSIKKGYNNLVVYSATNSNLTSKTDIYNTVSTPAGGQFHIILSDGTGVWLNAMSSIKFPVLFARSERRVEVSGEVYFEVKHSSAQPFRVYTGNSMIEDVGTRFNVNSYKDEPLLKTTLVEGSIRVHFNKTSALLKPGQQAKLNELEKSSIDVEEVNLEEIMAWKNGIFKFDDTPITEVMKQISRWYGINIIYKGQIPNKTLSGEISRDVNISSVLEMLHFFKVQFTTIEEGNKKTIIINS